MVGSAVFVVVVCLHYGGWCCICCCLFVYNYADLCLQDVQLMRHRSHVLHSLLDGFVLRRGHEILMDSLPPKYEHTLLLRPSPVQAVLYNYSIEQIHSGPGNSSAGPLKAFAVCSKVRGGGAV